MLQAAREHVVVAEELSYPEHMPPLGRYRYCPMCTSPLKPWADQETIERKVCPACEWTYYPANVLGVNIVPVLEDGQVVVLLPPGEPASAPAALPGGVVEYGESPEQAAIREVEEETGLLVELDQDLGWWFKPDFPYGPMLSFMFSAYVVGGRLRGSNEGEARGYQIHELPAVSPQREGSRRALRAFLDARGHRDAR